MSGPERMCLACRTRRPKQDFVRLSLSPEGEPVWDIKGKLPGRGVNLCPTINCLQRGLEPERLRRGFAQDDLDTGSPRALILQLKELYLERIFNLVRIAVKAGKVLSGFTKVQQALQHNHAELLVVTHDIAPQRRRELLDRAIEAQVTYMQLFEQEQLGALFGVPERSSAVIADAGIADQMRTYYRIYRNLEEGTATWEK